MIQISNVWAAPVFGLALLTLSLIAPKGATAQTFSDDNFVDSNWATELCPNVPLTNNSSFRVTQDTGNGNSAPSRHITHEYDTRIELCQLRSSAIVAPSQNEIAALNFRLDGEYEDATPGTAQCFAIAPLIRQGGEYFRATPFWSTCRNQGWISSTASFAAEDFVRIDRDDAGEPQHPDFSCGATPIELGFATGNQTGSATAASSALTSVARVDNWVARVESGESCTPPPAPYQCYDILDHSQDLHPGRRVATDQFGEMESRFGHPVALCNPAAVGDEYSEDQRENEVHYVCYQTLGRNRDGPRRVVISNAFDQDNELVLGGRDMICLPSSKRVVERAED